MLNRQPRPVIDELEIVSPCSMNWDSMEGDDKIRHCESCDKSVFNLAQMTRKEIEGVLLAQMNTGRTACIRMYKRPDGTVVTSDCLSVRQKLRRSIKRSSAKLAAASAAIFALTGVSALQSQVNAQDAFCSDEEVHPATALAPKTTKTAAIQPAQGDATVVQGVGGAGTVRVDNTQNIDSALGPLFWIPLLALAGAIFGILATCAEGAIETAVAHYRKSAR